jgi:hypothetical protein
MIYIWYLHIAYRLLLTKQGWFCIIAPNIMRSRLVPSMGSGGPKSFWGESPAMAEQGYLLIRARQLTSQA